MSNLLYDIVPCKQGNNDAAPPLSKIMLKPDEDSSGIDPITTATNTDTKTTMR
jgi:hypothetical protein